MGMTVAESIQREYMRMDIPAFRSGDTVKVHVKIREGEKERSHRDSRGPQSRDRRQEGGVPIDGIGVL